MEGNDNHIYWDLWISSERNVTFIIHINNYDEQVSIDNIIICKTERPRKHLGGGNLSRAHSLCIAVSTA